MNVQKLQTVLAAIAVGVALSATSAVAQTAGPGGAYFGAGSGPQTGAQPFSASQAQPARNAAGQSKKLYNSTAAQPSGGQVAGLAGANYGAGSNPQTGK